MRISAILLQNRRYLGRRGHQMLIRYIRPILRLWSMQEKARTQMLRRVQRFQTASSPRRNRSEAGRAIDSASRRYAQILLICVLPIRLRTSPNGPSGPETARSFIPSTSMRHCLSRSSASGEVPLHSGTLFLPDREVDLQENHRPWTSSPVTS